jgi:hypothetical protein
MTRIPKGGVLSPRPHLANFALGIGLFPIETPLFVTES